MSAAESGPVRPGRRAERPAVVLSPQPPATWETFATAALRGLVGLLALLVLVMGVLTESWAVALATAKVALVALFVLATWLYLLWFKRRRRALSRRDEDPERSAAVRLHDFKPR